MWSLRQRIFIGVSVAVGVGIAIILLLLFGRARSPQSERAAVTREGEQVGSTLPQEGSSPSPQSSGQPFVPSAPLSPPADPEETFLKQQARIFLERFQSYSTQNGNAHLAAVLPLVTARMAAWVETQEVKQEESYTGITTKAISSSILRKEEGRVDVLVGVQQIKTGSSGEAIIYRTGTVTLVKFNGTWKVDAFFWKE